MTPRLRQVGLLHVTFQEVGQHLEIICVYVKHFSGPYPHLAMIFKQLKMEGFLQNRWEHKHAESLKRLMAWLQEVPLFWPGSVLVSFCSTLTYPFCLCRGNCSIGNTSLKALKTCQLLLWGCCRERTWARQSSRSDVLPTRDINTNS